MLTCLKHSSNLSYSLSGKWFHSLSFFMLFMHFSRFLNELWRSCSKCHDNAQFSHHYLCFCFIIFTLNCLHNYLKDLNWGSYRLKQNNNQISLLYEGWASTVSSSTLNLVKSRDCVFLSFIFARDWIVYAKTLHTLC